jgi:FkbM family methyltransferase
LQEIDDKSPALLWCSVVPGLSSAIALMFMKISDLRLLSWLPPSAATYIYTVLLKPPPMRRLTQSVVKRFIPPVMNFRGASLALNQKDAIVSGSLALGFYESFVIDVIENLLQPGMTFLDVGANIGLYTALAARVVGPSGRVIAVEPSGSNCAVIKETVRLNAFNNVTIFEGAASDGAGRTALYLCDDNPADHRLHDRTGQRAKVEVETITLDALAAAHGVRHADLIKIDTQGAEASVFGGMTALLTVDPAPVITLEFWPWGLAQAGSDPRSLLDRIIAAGFSLYELDGDRRQIVPRNDLTALVGLNLERQHINLLLCKEPYGVEKLRVALNSRRV